MDAIESHVRWLRRFAIPSVLLTAAVVIWGSVMGILIYRILGVSTTSVDGLPAKWTDVFLLNGLCGALPTILVHVLALIALLMGRIAYRAWLIVVLLVFFGTPLTLLSGWKIADYLWTQNLGGIAWEGFVPQLIGLSISWIGALALDRWLL